MCDDDGEICESVTQQAVQASPATPNFATAEAQTDAQFQTKKYNNNNKSSTRDLQHAEHWQLEEVQHWIASTTQHFSCSLLDCLRHEAIDGQVLLALTEQDVRDMRYKLGYKLTFGELKKFWLAVQQLQQQWQQQQHFKQQLMHGVRPRSPNNSTSPLVLGITGQLTQASLSTALGAGNGGGNVFMPLTLANEPCPCPPAVQECASYLPDCDAVQKMGKRLVAPEYFKTAISLGYSFVVTWITSFVMVIVHERVPDMKRYPPLPDIFLDNVPHIPWAFNMCEITGSLLFTVWLFVLIFHKYRMALLRRFFALAGTVFLLRCVTMLITSLSVPGTHLQCNQKDFAIDDPNVDVFGALVIRMTRAYRIWSGLGMSIQGVRTCGDYMFSGHTVALTLLNFFITEYTPRNLYFLHTLTWLLNMFGIFFILAAHEHYSIDVFVAFYITSRLFLYYHTLANNRALMQSDSTRTRIWFPMFSYFENSVDGIIPNEFDTPGTLIDSLINQIVRTKDQIMAIAHRYWLVKPPISSSVLSEPEPRNHTHPAASNYFSIRSNATSATAIATPTASATSTPQKLKRTMIDASVSPYASGAVVAAETLKNDSRTPLTEKKRL